MVEYVHRDYSVGDVAQAVTCTMDCLLERPGLKTLKIYLDQGIQLRTSQEMDTLSLVAGQDRLFYMQLSGLLALKFPGRCKTDYEKLGYFFKRLIETINLLS